MHIPSNESQMPEALTDFAQEALDEDATRAP